LADLGLLARNAITLVGARRPLPPCAKTATRAARAGERKSKNE
jgi:hypothetical protein